MKDCGRQLINFILNKSSKKALVEAIMKDSLEELDIDLNYLKPHQSSLMPSYGVQQLSPSIRNQLESRNEKFPEISTYKRFGVRVRRIRITLGTQRHWDVGSCRDSRWVESSNVLVAKQ